MPYPWNSWRRLKTMDWLSRWYCAIRLNTTGMTNWSGASCFGSYRAIGGARTTSDLSGMTARSGDREVWQTDQISRSPVKWLLSLHKKGSPMDPVVAPNYDRIRQPMLHGQDKGVTASSWDWVYIYMFTSSQEALLALGKSHTHIWRSRASEAPEWFASF